MPLDLFQPEYHEASLARWACKLDRLREKGAALLAIGGEQFHAATLLVPAFGDHGQHHSPNRSSSIFSHSPPSKGGERVGER